MAALHETIDYVANIPTIASITMKCLARPSIAAAILAVQYSPSNSNRPILRELMRKIQCVHNPEFDTKDKGWGTKPTMKFVDEEEVVEMTEKLRGINPPVTNDNIRERARMLAKLAMGEEGWDEIKELVLGLKKLEDVEKLIDLLRGVVRSPFEA
ncbi:MAG: hypothetical protein M1834_002730 [Cirrosporium novae-zelandiae]|nr:MAG: hypothetical protein M1834_002730 [Cirrosporium novae-zelandiae]